MQTEIKRNIRPPYQVSNVDGIYSKYIKRIMDFLLSLIVSIILSPVLLIVALLVRTKLGSPIIFKQKRPGVNEKIFTLYKFRTMTDEKGDDGRLLPDNVRLTKFGRVLRATSLDELPELFNILKGDMSFIGPRPLVIQYLPYYNEIEKQRHDVRPGLSGLAQVNGRNSTTWEQRFYYDIKYINEICFINDFKIIIKTIYKVFKQEDIGIRGVDSPIDFDVYRKNQLVNEKQSVNEVVNV